MIKYAKKSFLISEKIKKYRRCPALKHNSILAMKHCRKEAAERHELVFHIFYS